MQPEPATNIQRPSDYERLNDLENRILQLQLDSLQKSAADHEARLRTLEDTATKFNFLLYLTMGGGLVSLFNLMAIAYLIISAGQK